MVDPILTLVLPISICRHRNNSRVANEWCEKRHLKHQRIWLLEGKKIKFISLHANNESRSVYTINRTHKKWKLNNRLTACSKSPDMPIDSSHWDSVIPNALHTSLLQFNRVYCIAKLIILVFRIFFRKNEKMLKYNSMI